MNIGAIPSYARKFEKQHQNQDDFGQRRSRYLNDRIGGAHLLGPVLNAEEWASFTICRDSVLQAAWAKEHGLPDGIGTTDILSRQIEDHRTEVFYNLDPLGFDDKSIRELPGCVKHKLCWRAAPSPGADFSAYDRVLCNFPGILSMWQNFGWKTAHFFPAHDPELDAYARNDERPIDVCFVGGFSRHHRSRIAVLNAVVELSDKIKVRYYLDLSRVTRIAEHPALIFLPLSRFRRSRAIKAVSRDPVFGRDYYDILGKTKIVLNGAIDMAQDDRGNMRCFEAMGAKCLLISDRGNYPPGMDSDRTMLSYSSPSNAADLITAALDNWEHYNKLANEGFREIRNRYSKENQWTAFKEIVAAI